MSAAIAVALQLARLCLVATFAFAGAGKIGAPRQTRRSLEQFGIPSRFGVLVATVLPALEFSIALGLSYPNTVHIAAAAALALLCLFTVAVSVNLWQGHRPECACFGAMRASRISGWTVGRDLLLAAMAIVILVSASGREFASARQPRGSNPISGILWVTLLGGSLGVTAWSISRRVPRRVSRAILRSSPPIGLSLGTRAPQFLVSPLDGGIITLESLIGDGRWVLLIFASSACAQCARVMPDVAQMEEDRSGRVSVAVIFSGSPEAARRMVTGHGIGIVAMDSGLLTQKYHVRGVPAAVLIGPTGIVASRTAAGVQPVLNLLAQIRAGAHRELGNKVAR